MNNIEPLNIVIVIYDDVYSATGTTVRLHRLIDFLGNLGNVTIISSSDVKSGKLSNTLAEITTINLGSWLLAYKSLPFPLKFVPALIWNFLLFFVLLKLKCNLVFDVHDLIGYPAVYLASLFKRYKIVFEAHSIISWDNKERGHSSLLLDFEKKLEKFLCKHSNFVITLSRNTFDYYSLYTDNIALTNVFVDTEIFYNHNTKENTDKKNIGLIGPFSSGDSRGMYYLDFIAANIESFDARISIIAIGRCDKPVTHDRIFYTGFLDSLNDYVEQLSQLDAVIVPEEIGSAGPLNKILEPMSCSLPVFVTPKAIIGLYHIENGINIFVFNEDEIVDNINTLILQDDLLKKVGINARYLVERYYSKSANYKQLTNILTEVVHS